MTTPAASDRRFRLRRGLLGALFAFAALAGAAPAGAQGFQAVTSRNGFDVWAVGDAGSFSRSFDGGATWTPGTLTTTRTLRGIAHRGLTVIAVADSGIILRSTDNGVTWTRTVIAGTPDLKAVEMPADGIAVIVGANETILRTDDGGAVWTPQGSPGAATLLGLRMTSATTGWACGSGGRLLATVDGATWNPIAVPTTNDLFAVDGAGSRLWVVGGYGTCLRSTTSGASWTPINLRMELPLDVRAVTITGAQDVTLSGGGGFIRSSADDGATWTFASHPLLAATTDYFVYDATRAWATAGRTRAVVRTFNGGAGWLLPTGTTSTWDWQLKRSAGNATVRGNTFACTPLSRNSVWAVMGTIVYKSVDRGDSWAVVDTIPSAIKTNSFYVSAKDTNIWVAATGSTDRITRTANAGATWTTTLSVDFTEYGMPLEMNVEKPDTLHFGPEDGRIYRSADFGQTWAIISNPGFRSPCDIVVSPDNESNIVVGDGVTGVGLAKIWQSENGGTSFSDRYTSASSETPCVWSSRLGNTTLFATNWSTGGVWRSQDSGKNWTQVTTVMSAWGGYTAPDDPKVVLYNRYAGSPNYVSTDGGLSFTSTAITGSGSGYACFALDRGTLLDMHSAGIYKLNPFYTLPAPPAQTLTLSAPNGGEVWNAGSVHGVTWTAGNLALVAIEWRAAPADPWIPVAQVDAAPGNYFWTVPAVATTTAEVRVRDAADSAPVDISNAVFTIVDATPQLTVLAPDGGEKWQYAHTEAITWSSSNVTDVAIDWRGSDVAPWIELVASTPAAAGSWNWVLPPNPTAQASVRVRAVGGGLSDTSDSLFQVTVPDFIAYKQPKDFGGVPVGYATWDTLRIQNDGTAPLTVSLVASDNPAFTVPRSSFIVAAGTVDTLSLWYLPGVPGPDSALFTFTADDPAGTHTVRVRGAGTVAVGVPAPTYTFAFEAPRPNPFAGVTSVQFTLAEPTDVALEVFDLSGRRVAVLARGVHEPGPHVISFRPAAHGGYDGTGLSAGVYFVRLTAGPHVRTRKLLYLAR